MLPLPHQRQLHTHTNALSVRQGSTVNRSAKPPSAGSLAFCQYCKRNFRVGKRGARCPARLRHPHVARQTLKDNDLKFKLRLGLRTETVIQQIRQDVRTHARTCPPCL